MLKSDLIKHLESNLNKYGDSEIQVELLNDLGSNGKVYDIIDVVNVTGLDFEADYIAVFDYSKNSIDSKKLISFLNKSRESFLQSQENSKFEDTKEYYSGLADGMLNVLEFIQDNVKESKGEFLDIKIHKE
ncbi:MULTISPECIES: hypothetical protein [Lysinibacillus]|uniref:hypothetical protein n=1 Tax=Lysinibacillus TaxID=400634 RepID=UPI00214C92FB|nr:MULTISPECIES: hypothetical protein [Lysinibacillus]UUV25884.1 hypothetical protein NP781_04510 [Lysinibacillus sp. FN11]UYB48757.1 hypothetical protein OCI51_07300 [Lysinibacillus capsici]